MGIYVTGDYHGGRREHLKFTDESAAVWRTEPCDDDIVIVAGDFGLPWFWSADEVQRMEWLAGRPWTTAFVDGNHENFDELGGLDVVEWHGGRAQVVPGYGFVHLMRGEVYELGGSSLFTMGGATSIDAAYRTPGFDWWPQELPDEADFDNARANLDRVGWKVDYVVTHTCSAGLQPSALYPFAGWEHPLVDRLNMFLGEVDARLDFKRWYFGHFHRDMDVDGRHVLLYDRVVRLGDSVV